MTMVKKFVATVLICFSVPIEIGCATEKGDGQNQNTQEARAQAANEVLGSESKALEDVSAQIVENELFDASRKGDEQAAQELLAQKVRVDCKDEEGSTPLMIASQEGHAGIVRRLLEAGAHVDKQRNDGRTALMAASFKGYKDVVETLLIAKASVDKRCSMGLSALMFAAVNGQVEIVNRLIRAGANVNAQDINGCPLLLYVANKGHVDVARVLLAEKAFVDAQDQQGVTALMRAAFEDDANMIALLLDARARVDIQTKKSGETALLVAVRRNNLVAVRALLRENCIKEQINMQSKEGNTALIFAVDRNNVDISILLLRAGADVNIHNNKGLTVLMIAANRNHGMILDILFKEVHLDINKQDEAGYTALMMAAQHGYTEILDRLLACNAFVDIKSNNGETALLVAVANGHVNAVQRLLKAGSDVDAQNNNRITALMRAAAKDNAEFINLLLDAKAEVDIKGNHGWTALMGAVDKGYIDIVKRLVLAGANPNCVFINGCTVFDLAKQPGMLQVIVDARAERTKREELVRVTQKDIPDLSVMLALAAHQQDQWMVPWLLMIDSQADANGGTCSICAEKFVERVVNDGVELHRATQACPHLVCDECEELQCRAQAAPDTDRDRGIYLGQNADGVDQWMLPGHVNLSRCPECRAEQDGPAFVPTASQQAQFDQLKEEFKELELARRLSHMLKRTNVLRRFIPEAGVIDLVDDYAAVAPADAEVGAGN